MDPLEQSQNYHLEVQDLVKMMFDVEQMKKTMVEFEVSVQSKSMHFKFLMKI